MFRRAAGAAEIGTGAFAGVFGIEVFNENGPVSGLSQTSSEERFSPPDQTETKRRNFPASSKRIRPAPGYSFTKVSRFCLIVPPAPSTTACPPKYFLKIPEMKMSIQTASLFNEFTDAASFSDGSLTFFLVSVLSLLVKWRLPGEPGSQYEQVPLLKH